MNIRLTRGNINSFYNDNAIGNFLNQHLVNLSGTVLDIGCGRMRHKETVLSGANVKKYVGLDLEPGKFGYTSKADIYWDGVKMPIADNSIESALLFEVLEHCANPSLVLKETARVLKPGGVLLISTPFLYQLHGIPFDFNRYTPWNLTNLLKDAGFKDIELTASGSIDASLGQMIGIWIHHRPMPFVIRKILSIIFVPVFKILLWADKKNIRVKKNVWNENDIMPGILGIIRKT